MQAFVYLNFVYCLEYFSLIYPRTSLLLVYVYINVWGICVWCVHIYVHNSIWPCTHMGRTKEFTRHPVYSFTFLKRIFPYSCVCILLTPAILLLTSLTTDVTGICGAMIFSKLKSAALSCWYLYVMLWGMQSQLLILWSKCSYPLNTSLFPRASI